MAKLGRNVLLFQEAEHLLKWLGAKQKVSGAPIELEEGAREACRVVGRETLGGVVGRAIVGQFLSTRPKLKVMSRNKRLTCTCRSSSVGRRSFSPPGGEPGGPSGGSE